MSMNLAIENKNNTRRRRPKWEVLHQFALREVVVVFLFRLGACVCA
jgi:hypothetical protein